ncbi:MAG: hypothetical protein MUF15_22805 [Acidobacteria bacterium]|jgi:hypothetical protein|nr:hypothetical protein [Acidobacteriota bacterium]
MKSKENKKNEKEVKLTNEELKGNISETANGIATEATEATENQQSVNEDDHESFTTDDQLFTFTFTIKYDSSGSLQDINTIIIYNISPPLSSNTYNLNDFIDHDVEITANLASPPADKILWGTLRQQPLTGPDNGIWFNIYYSVNKESEHHIEGIFVNFPKVNVPK